MMGGEKLTITSVSINREAIPIDVRLPDPGWRFKDSDGGVHKWARKEDGSWHLPTLREVVDDVPVPGEPGESCAVRSYFAPTGEEAFPGTRVERRYIPGLIDGKVTFTSRERPMLSDDGQHVKLRDCAFAIGPYIPTECPEELHGFELFVTGFERRGARFVGLAQLVRV